MAEFRNELGKSDSIGDQALECMAALDKWLERYLNSEPYKSALEYASDEDKEMLNEGFILMKQVEKWAIDWSECNERMEHKLDKIYKLVEEINLK